MPTALTPNAWLRYDLVRRWLTRRTDVDSVLEVGCGQGAVGARLAARFDYRGFEPDEASAAVARERIARLGRGEVRNCLLPAEPDRPFDLLAAFEVIEHLEDDVGALTAWSRWLRPGGWVLVSVPAGPHRFAAADRAVGHFRRYSRASLTATLERAGFTEIEVQGYGFPLGYLLEAARNRLFAAREKSGTLAERTAESGRLYQPEDRHAWVNQLATAPFRWLQRPFVNSDWATGWVAWGRKA